MLPTSEIGEAAVFARRSGTRRFVAAMNGREARTLTIPLEGFARAGRYDATIGRDALDDPGAMVVEARQLNPDASIDMRVAGGFVVRLTPR